jgi:hypothetical protein
MAFYLMVKGPCIGKTCDFWAWIGVRKLICFDNIRSSVIDCDE